MVEAQTLLQMKTFYICAANAVTNTSEVPFLLFEIWGKE